VFHNVLKKKECFQICNQITGKEVGTVVVHMYEENTTGLPIYTIQPENKHMLSLSRTIENTLNKHD
jgi:hypothetical protein